MITVISLFIYFYFSLQIDEPQGAITQDALPGMQTFILAGVVKVLQLISTEMDGTSE